MSQYNSYLDNLGFVLGVESKEGDGKPRGQIHDVTNPSTMAQLDSAYGIKR